VRLIKRGRYYTRVFQEKKVDDERSKGVPKTTRWGPTIRGKKEKPMERRIVKNSLFGLKHQKREGRPTMQEIFGKIGEGSEDEKRRAHCAE